VPFVQGQAYLRDYVARRLDLLLSFCNCLLVFFTYQSKRRSTWSYHVQFFRTLLDGRLLSNKICHQFACHRQDKNLESNAYRKTLYDCVLVIDRYKAREDTFSHSYRKVNLFLGRTTKLISIVLFQTQPMITFCFRRRHSVQRSKVLWHSRGVSGFSIEGIGCS
jgi:hypothetical protein